jgi:hypothetical protein
LQSAPAAPQAAAVTTPPVATTPIDSIVGLIGSSESMSTTTTAPRPKAASSSDSGNLLSRLSRLLVGSLG